MKAVFISYNQAFKEEILDIMLKAGVKGYTNWEEVTGRGSRGGDPHLGDHAWPTLNSAMIAMMDDSIAEDFMKRLNKKSMSKLTVPIQEALYLLRIKE